MSPSLPIQRDRSQPNLKFTSPVAEKTFRSMRSAAKDRPEIHFVAVSHSDQQSTDKWLKAIGGAGDIGIVVDHDRTLYARWGLDISSLWHVLNPWSLWNVYKLGKTDGIWNKPTESGSRWQTTGMFVVDGQGVVRWGGASVTADEIPDYNEAVHSLS